MSTTDKPVTVRLPQSQLRELMGLSVLDGGNLAEQLRRAVSEYVVRRIEDPDLAQKVEEARNRHTSVLEVLNRP
jgi:hypothetical protein